VEGYDSVGVIKHYIGMNRIPLLPHKEEIK